VQAAVVAAELIIHCRSGEDMGLLTLEKFAAALRDTSTPMPFLPAIDTDVVLLRTGYRAHQTQARPPKDFAPAPLPASWRAAERCIVKDVSSWCHVPDRVRTC
jgi:hypothetical protein